MKVIRPTRIIGNNSFGFFGFPLQWKAKCRNLMKLFFFVFDFFLSYSRYLIDQTVSPSNLFFLRCESIPILEINM
ncbi:hypothetical protein SNEBB_001475 [Seison nebaliae]|nr:hypothetical protein SNEBB_001475 [Seison nebaliae]